jgi:hypothetical protein
MEATTTLAPFVTRTIISFFLIILVFYSSSTELQMLATDPLEIYKN